MAFTYSDDLATDRDRLRFAIQDTAADDGPRPSRANFTDSELDGLLTIEGTWQRAVAAAFEALAAQWSRYASYTVGPRGEQLAQVAEAFKKQAELQRQNYGYGSTTAAFGTVAATRVDAYSDDKDATEATVTGTEYEPIKWYVEYERE